MTASFKNEWIVNHGPGGNWLCDALSKKGDGFGVDVLAQDVGVARLKSPRDGVAAQPLRKKRGPVRSAHEPKEMIAWRDEVGPRGQCARDPDLFKWFSIEPLNDDGMLQIYHKPGKAFGVVSV